MEAIDIKDDKLDKRQDLAVDVYAELSKKQYNLIQREEVSVEIPHGVSMSNKTGSRALVFSCVNEKSAKELEQGLENSHISWQENYHEKVVSRNRRHAI